MQDIRQIVAEYWAAAEARRWDDFAALLDDDVIYELPQSRERIRGRDRYVRFNAEYPGDWHVEVSQIIAQGSSATAITFFESGDARRIRQIVDWWPEPYVPPARPAGLIERF